MNLKSIMLSERSQTQMTSYYKIAFTWNSRKKLVMKSKSVGAKGRKMGLNEKGEF